MRLFLFSIRGIVALPLAVFLACATPARPVAPPVKQLPELRFLARVPTDKQPKQVCFHPRRDEFYVTNLGGAGPTARAGSLGPGSLQIFSLKDFSLLHREPAHAAVECSILAPAHETLVYSDMFRDEIVVFDLKTRTVRARIGVREASATPRRSGFQFMPKVIEPTPDGKRAYVSLWLGGVSLVDLERGETILRSDKFCAHPRGLYFDAKSGLLHVMCYGIPDGKGMIVQLDGQTLRVVGRRITGGSPRHIIHLPEDRALTGNLNSGRLELYDPATGTFGAGMHIGGAPNTFDADPWGYYAYISRRARNNVGVVDLETMQLVQELKTGKFPTGLDVRADGKYLAVTNFDEASVDIFAID